ncbi:hypothetical protein KAMFAM_248 [Bacillus phage Kamfam]|nr:hypothetical protein OTK52_246 [Bacillus phage OTooleKemple52]AXQ67086.1 hypothetical protein KAMFAM_248 [Bacillus phage Kamfam]
MSVVKVVYVNYIGDVYELQRKVSMDGSYYFVNLNGELRCTLDLNKPFPVSALPRGARRIGEQDINKEDITLGKLIKTQNELQDKIASLEDASREIGKDIFEMFKKLPEEEIHTYYRMMNKENESYIRFEIFKEFVLHNKSNGGN